ncbi:MAG: MaoC/PaaZ C-terminal domain-containing protein [Ktedonobacterales bacterium]
MALLDPSLVGNETAPETVLITPEDIRAFAEAIGDNNPIFFDESAALQAGFASIPMSPTFVTRLRVPFAEAGLNPEQSQVLHVEQEYTYTRPTLAGDILVGRHRVSSIRLSGRGDMAIMTLEQLCDSPEGDRIITGKATLIIREMSAAGSSGIGSSRSRPRLEAQAPEVAALRLDCLVTQEQIDAYAEVSGDHNPIHVDPEAARAVGLDGTIAHGMLSMAFAGRVLTNWLYGQAERGGWIRRLHVRFQAMVRPGDSLSCFGNPLARNMERQSVELWIDNQQGERVISGDAEAIFSGV